MVTSDDGDDASRTPGSGDSAKAAGPAPRCPTCGKPMMQAYRPFCSKRCADVDLSRWLNAVYAVPGRPEGEDEDEEA